MCAWAAAARTPGAATPRPGKHAPPPSPRRGRPRGRRRRRCGTGYRHFPPKAHRHERHSRPLHPPGRHGVVPVGATDLEALRRLVRAEETLCVHPFRQLLVRGEGRDVGPGVAAEPSGSDRALGDDAVELTLAPSQLARRVPRIETCSQPPFALVDQGAIGGRAAPGRNRCEWSRIRCRLMRLLSCRRVSHARSCCWHPTRIAAARASMVHGYSLSRRAAGAPTGQIRRLALPPLERR